MEKATEISKEVYDIIINCPTSPDWLLLLLLLLLRRHTQPKELCPAPQILRLSDELTDAYQVVVKLSPGISPRLG